MFWGSSFNDGTTQTALDPLGRGPVRTHCGKTMCWSSVSRKDRLRGQPNPSSSASDWIVIPWDGTDPHPGKSKPHKLAPTWQGPYKVTGPGRSDSLIAVIDPADLKPYEFPVARCRLYNLAPGDNCYHNPVEIIAWDTLR
jgi:hypothetical protein